MNDQSAIASPHRAVIYARFPTDMQNPTSVEDQVALCRKTAEEKGWDVVDVRSDHGLSGTLRDRPGFLALEEDIQRKHANLILFESLDRLSRDSEHTALFYKLATHAEAELYALDGGFLDAIRVGFRSTMAAAFLENLAFKTRRGLGDRVAAGKSAGGLSYGYASGDETGTLVIDEDEATIARRIYCEYSEGKSPLKIAAGLNADLIPSPAKGTKRKTSGHWKQNTINGNAERGTGILNNELYVGRRVWNRLRYSKDPITGRRVSRLNDQSKWSTTEVPELRIIDEETWAAAKARQTAMRALRGKREPGMSTLTATRNNRRRKYFLSGLDRCGLCGGPMTIAGGNRKAGKRRYYCANAREKGESICEGMPGVSQSEIEELSLSGFRHGMMQDAAYERFRQDFEGHLRATQSTVGEDLRLRDRMIAEQQAKVDNIFEAIETGEFSPPLVARLNKLQAELDQMKSQREAATPAPVELPDDLPALYQAHVEDLVGSLSDPSVRECASDALRELISAVVVRPHPAGGHKVKLEGKLLKMLAKAKPAGKAIFWSNERSFQLVAGVGFEPTTFRL